MTQLDPLRYWLVADAARTATYWCKQADGTIVEHEANAYHGHDNHLRCIPVADAGETPDA